MPDPTDRATAAVADPQLAGQPMRASDADRHATVQQLQDAIARGLLTPAEGSDRMGTAFAAVHLEDLEPITADLPRSTSHSKSKGWRPLLLMVLEQLQSSLRGAITGRRRSAQLGAALLLVLLLITGGLVFAHLFLDNGGGPGHGGFERR